MSKQSWTYFKIWAKKFVCLILVGFVDFIFCECECQAHFLYPIIPILGVLPAFFSCIYKECVEPKMEHLFLKNKIKLSIGKTISQINSREVGILLLSFFFFFLE